MPLWVVEDIADYFVAAGSDGAAPFAGVFGATGAGTRIYPLMLAKFSATGSLISSEIIWPLSAMNVTPLIFADAFGRVQITRAIAKKLQGGACKKKGRQP
jgi:hypothetical protein